MKCAGATTSAPRYNIYSVTLKAGLEETPPRPPSPRFHPLHFGHSRKSHS